MNNTNYNGWTNKQTWNINLTYGEIFSNMCQEQRYDDVEHVAESFEQIVDELEFQGLREGTLAHQAVGEYLDRVDWMEIAEHFASDFELFVEDNNEEEEPYDYVGNMRCRIGNK